MYSDITNPDSHSLICLAFSVFSRLCVVVLLWSGVQLRGRVHSRAGTEELGRVPGLVTLLSTAPLTRYE